MDFWSGVFADTDFQAQFGGGGYVPSDGIPTFSVTGTGYADWPTPPAIDYSYSGFPGVFDWSFPSYGGGFDLQVPPSGGCPVCQPCQPCGTTAAPRGGTGGGTSPSATPKPQQQQQKEKPFPWVWIAITALAVWVIKENQ